MKNYEYWEKFSKTGNIFDYLNYTACTVEDFAQLLSKVNEEGDDIDDSNGSDGDGIVRHAHW